MNVYLEKARRFLMSEYVWLGCILFVAILLRTYKLGEIPGGMNQDEALAAYEALALARNGIDMHGYGFPLMFVAWGSGMHVLTSYLAIPSIYLFGISTWSFRLGHLLFSLASLPIFYLLLRKAFSQQVAFLGFLLISIAPWHIMMSRWSLESNILPATFLLAVTFLCYSKEKPYLFLASSFCFGLSLYAYGTSYLITPLFFLISFVVAQFKWHFPAKYLTIGAFIFGILCAPIIYYIAVNSFGFPEIRLSYISIPKLPSVPRYSRETFFSSPSFVIDVIKRIVPLIKFIVNQNDGWIFNALPWSGALYPWTIAFSFFGIGLCTARLQKKFSAEQFLFLVWVLLAVFVGLYFKVPNINRLNIIFLPLIGFAAVGLHKFASNRYIYILVLLVYVIGLSHFSYNYFYKYKSSLNANYNSSFLEAVNYAVALNASSSICITNSGVTPYPYALIAAREMPLDFIATRKVENPGAQFEEISSFGRFTFGLNRCHLEENSIVVLRIKEVNNIPNVSILKTLGDFQVGLIK